MSRVAKNPIALPSGVDVTVESGTVRVKGAKGELDLALAANVNVEVLERTLHVRMLSDEPGVSAIAGTTRAIVANMVTGVSSGFERRLQLVGVGYRAAAQGQSVTLSLGFSHPVLFAVPVGVTVETPSQTEIVIRGVDKQAVGQVAAKIRSFRPPEPYKGKGVRYSNERVLRKEAKKK